MKAKVCFTALLLAVSTTLFAQAPATGDKPPGGREKMRSCAQEPDPAKCEARRKEIREHMKSARDACNAKQGPERQACIAQAMCAKAPDPARCHARAKERMDKRQAREKGKA